MGTQEKISWIAERGVSDRAWERWAQLVLLGLASIIVAYGVGAPEDPVIRYTHGLDGLEHFGAFFVLAAITLWRGRAGVLKFVLLAEIAAGVEIAQGLFIPTRHASMSDFAWGFFGAACAAALIWSVRRALGLRARTGV